DQLSSSLPAWFIDKFTAMVVSIPADQVSKYSFSITEDPSSAMPDRFRVVFSRTRPVVENLLTTENIRIFPNPVEGNRIGMQFSHMTAGNYEVQILNSLGQTVISKTIHYAGGSSLQELPLENKLAAGIYQLQVRGTNIKSTAKLLVNN
ncbi:MAG: T9SS type A sorting domain-containing protein, partial [Flavisolibacter sp.]